MTSLFIEASRKWEEGSLAQAFDLFRRAAKMGDAAAAGNLGYFYDEGMGTERDEEMALYWYKKASRAGDFAATMNLAKFYERKNDLKKAKYWLCKLVRRGDGDAMLELARIYLSRPQKRYKKAVSLLEQALEQSSMTEASREVAQKMLDEIRSGR